MGAFHKKSLSRITPILVNYFADLISIIMMLSLNFCMAVQFSFDLKVNLETMLVSSVTSDMSWGSARVYSGAPHDSLCSACSDLLCINMILLLFALLPLSPKLS